MSERIPSNYLSLFSLVPDLRKSGHLIRHDLFDMIFIAIAACVSGVDDWDGICLWGESQKRWLQKFCTLTNGIPRNGHSGGYSACSLRMRSKKRLHAGCRVSSLSCDRKRFGELVREHWGIENSLRWVLDIVFDEDQKRSRKGHGAENISTIRRIALNLLRDCPMKGGIKIRRIFANADCAIREKVLKI